MSAAKYLRESKAITEAALESTQTQLAEAVAALNATRCVAGCHTIPYDPIRGSVGFRDYIEACCPRCAFLARFDGKAGV